MGSFASRITFFFSAENELLQKLAKYRAARRLWARLMKERFAARDPRSQPMRFQVQSAALSLTLQQPMKHVHDLYDDDRAKDRRWSLADTADA